MRLAILWRFLLVICLLLILTLATITEQASNSQHDTLAPTITHLSRNQDRVEGGSEVVVTGTNFTADLRLVLGDDEVTDPIIESATQLRFHVPRQRIYGGRILTLRNANGVAQCQFNIVAKPLAELAEGEITTIGGGLPYFGDGRLVSDRDVIFYPNQLATDAAGNIFLTDLADLRKGMVRRIAADTNLITTVAGGGVPPDRVGDGKASEASFLYTPIGLSFDRQGNLYVVDQFDERVRRIDAVTGIITTVAGGGNEAGDGLLATNVRLDTPGNVVIDRAGNIYITNRSAFDIRRVDAVTGIITTVAVKCCYPVTLNEPADDQDTLITLDLDRVLRVDLKTGLASVIAGTNAPGYNGDGILATNAQLFYPQQVITDSAGNIFIADALNHRVRRVDRLTGIITTVAGNGKNNYSGDGGPATQASLYSPSGLAFDPQGNLLIADANIRRVDAKTGIITAVGGFGYRWQDLGDNDLATSASLPTAFGIAIDQFDDIYYVGSALIRKITNRTGIINTIAGNGDFVYSGDNGPALKAGMDPSSIAVDGRGNIFINEDAYDRVRKIDGRTGTITTVAGGGSGGDGEGGLAIDAALAEPSNVAVDASGNLFITDSSAQRVKRVDVQTGIITTVAGDGYLDFFGDNRPAKKASLAYPNGIALDRSGNLFIADGYSYRIRRVDHRTGFITTVAGNGSSGTSGDGGPATAAEIGLIENLAIDGAGNIFMTDFYNLRIRRVDHRTGIITTVAGPGCFQIDGNCLSGDGGLAINASLVGPYGVAFDSAGNLHFTDVFFGFYKYFDRFITRIRAIKGIGRVAADTDIAITEITLQKNNLKITGQGFGAWGAYISINGKDVSKLKKDQRDNEINFIGNLTRLGLKKGTNIVIVTNATGVESNRFELAR